MIHPPSLLFHITVTHRHHTPGYDSAPASQRPCQCAAWAAAMMQLRRVSVRACVCVQLWFAVLETFQRRRGRGYCASKYLKVNRRAVSPDLLRKHRRVIKQAPNPTLDCQKHCFIPLHSELERIRVLESCRQKITC